MNELVIGDKTYISSKRAAEITGYAKDYVGQLCREGYVDAKMVGRSWYVLESSIREHRFGKQEVEDAAPPKPEKNAIPETWEAPKYSPEIAAPIPQVRFSEPVKASPKHDQTLSEMQDAWKEWFETRKDPLLEAPGAHEERLESPELMEAREESNDIPEALYQSLDEEGEDGEAVDIPITKLEKTDLVKENEAMPIVRPEQREPVRRAPQDRPRTNMIASSLLIALALLVIAAGVIGTGLGSKYVKDNAVVRFLGGTSTVQK